MCFSAEASFIVGAGLIPAGIYCTRMALAKKPSYLGLATVPLLFGIQQISEGFVWLALGREDAAQIRTASLVFLFFALALWPFWFPLQAAIMETQPRRKWILAFVSLLASSWFWILFFPIATGPESMLTTRVMHHSVQYSYPEVPVYRFIPSLILRIFYFATVAVPFVVSSERLGAWSGILLGASALVAALVFDYAYVSVWCFFAAVLAGLCCVIFHQLPWPEKADANAHA